MKELPKWCMWCPSIPVNESFLLPELFQLSMEEINESSLDELVTQVLNINTKEKVRALLARHPSFYALYAGLEWAIVREDRKLFEYFMRRYLPKHERNKHYLSLFLQKACRSEFLFFAGKKNQAERNYPSAKKRFYAGANHLAFLYSQTSFSTWINFLENRFLNSTKKLSPNEIFRSIIFSIYFFTELILKTVFYPAICISNLEQEELLSTFVYEYLANIKDELKSHDPRTFPLSGSTLTQITTYRNYILQLAEKYISFVLPYHKKIFRKTFRTLKNVIPFYPKTPETNTIFEACEKSLGIPPETFSTPLYREEKRSCYST